MNPTQTHGKESASCPMDFILRMLMGPWTTYIVYNLKTHGPQRFGELKRRVAGVSAKMLTERLRTLEGACLVRRDYEATIPPKVTYSLTQRGHELDDVLGKLAEIGMRWEAEDAARRAVRASELRQLNDGEAVILRPMAEGSLRSQRSFASLRMTAVLEARAHFGTLKWPCTKLRSMNDLGSASRDTWPVDCQNATCL